MGAGGVGAAALVAAAAAGAATVVRGRGLAAVTALAGLATASLCWALVAGDFTIAYVAGHTDRSTSWPYRLAALWGGMEGSLLWWALLVCGAGLVARPLLDRDATRVVAALVTGVLAVALLAANPFRALAVPAVDGSGLTPVLRHPAMLYHPPLVYAGQAALAVPFAVTVARLLRRRPLDGAWLARTRTAVLVPWLLLAVAMAAGAHWAYAELGWGGFWAWDPVENAALLPWLAATAFLHAVPAARRAARPVPGGAAPAATPPTSTAAGALVLLAFCLALLGAWLTRSGSVSSVHAFAEARAAGTGFLLLLLLAVGVSALALCRGVGTTSHAPAGPRDRALAAAVALLLGVVAVVAVGSVWPAVAGVFGGERVAVDARFYTLCTAPLAVALLALMAATPRLAGAGGRRPRLPPGAAVAHLGVAVLLVAAAASATGALVTAPLRPGEHVAVSGWTARHLGVETSRADRIEAAVALERGGRRVAVLRPRLDTPRGATRPLAETALRSTPLADVQVALRAVHGDRALLDVAVRPLAAWIWVGALLVAAGGLASLRRPVAPLRAEEPVERGGRRARRGRAASPAGPPARTPAAAGTPAGASAALPGAGTPAAAGRTPPPGG